MNESNAEFRITQLESNYKELAKDVSDIKSIVTRLDAKIGAEPLKCAVHTELMMQMRKEVDKAKDDVESIKTYMWKAVGAMGVVVLIIQLLVAPIVTRFIEGGSNNKVVIKDAISQVDTNMNLDFGRHPAIKGFATAKNSKQ